MCGRGTGPSICVDVVLVLLIVGKAGALALQDTVSGVEDRLGRTINYTVLSSRELAKWRGAGDPFLARVLNGPLVPVLGEVHGV